MIDGQRPFADGAHILYVNGAYQGESPIGRLMSDFRCTDADDIRDPLLQSRAKYFKETTEGVSSMCLLLEQMRNETAEKSMITTRVEDVRRLMAKLKIGVEDAIELLDVPTDHRAAVLAALREG